ncbi:MULTISPECIES: hypothetical protein [unclassified Shinella]|uniref:hypothetical protein n=1 Tax=unclassified Shinella TaxID=2643062 RepID=UPI00225C88CD|nr:MULTISPECIES: hypothetical protein [unclassified Shinella]MCO5139282.1 hypothetical protein [Shinella sp.]MDC7255989.1 hypothetical protein [Shinella sp. YE25]CAI0338825.1 conserved hypothetical protein [Rhizobiaceae bacterium]CAK7257255.1 conserved protein of unknown function [Shinella sp. WSC3-e]
MMDAPSFEWIDADTLIWLSRQGVDALRLAEMLPIRSAKGRRAVNGYFEEGGAGRSFLVFEEAEDLIFWQPETGELATWNNRAFALGEAAIDNAATYAFGANLNILPDPLTWMRSGRDGIVVLDWRFAFDKLRDVPRIAVAEQLLPTYRKFMKPRRMPSVSVIPAKERMAA